jgi:hypothetical protein
MTKMELLGLIANSAMLSNTCVFQKLSTPHITNAHN